MRLTLLTAVLIISLLSTCMLGSGCDRPENDPVQDKQKLEALYPGDITEVNSVQIRNGTTGELKTFTDKRQVQEWVNSIRDIEFVIDPNQEKRVGYLFFVDLFENDEKKLRFTPGDSEGVYYLYHQELEDRIRELFESK